MISTRARILVVDDNATNRELLAALLEPQGYDVVSASSGAECLEYLATNPADLVLLDVMMPGMDGFEVAGAIRSDPRHQVLPIVMVTALSETHDRVCGIEAGCDDFITKPFDKSEVLARTRSILRMAELRNRQVTRATAEARVLRHQLEAARHMQEALFPTGTPAVSGYEVWGINLSSLEVSGDYYDFVVPAADDERSLFAIADVSGKGAPAALLAANLHAGLHSHALAPRFDLLEAMRNLNRIVAARTPDGVFATMIVGELNARHSTLRYVRAGHEYPCVVHSDGSAESPAAGGGLLGIDVDMQFDLAEVTLAPHDLFCVYTDGVTDAEGPDGSPFGVGGLTAVLRENRYQSAGEIGNAVIGALQEFSPERTDDMTLIVIRRTA